MLGEFVSKAIPWIIPLFLLASLIYNWQTSGNSGSSQKKPPVSKDASDNKSKSEEVSDKDLTE